MGRFSGIFSMESQLTLVTVALLLVLLSKDDVAPGIYSLFFYPSDFQFVKNDFFFFYYTGLVKLCFMLWH